MTEEVEPIKDVVAEALKDISPATDDLPKPRAKKTAAVAGTEVKQYLVINGAIAPNGGGRADLVQPGSVVFLTNEQAKHYNNLGYLKPYIGD